MALFLQRDPLNLLAAHSSWSPRPTALQLVEVVEAAVAAIVAEVDSRRGSRDTHRVWEDAVYTAVDSIAVMMVADTSAVVELAESRVVDNNQDSKDAPEELGHAARAAKAVAEETARAAKVSVPSRVVANPPQRTPRALEISRPPVHRARCLRYHLVKKSSSMMTA